LKALLDIASSSCSQLLTSAQKWAQMMVARMMTDEDNDAAGCRHAEEEVKEMMNNMNN